MQKKCLANGLILILLLLTAACGFKLRGQSKLPSQLQTVYVNSTQPYGQFTDTLKNRLEVYGVKVVDEPQQAQLQLRVRPGNLEHKVTNASVSGDTQTYWLTYSVVFELADSQGNIILPQKPLTVGRNYVATRDQIRSDNHEIILIKQQMERELVDRLFNRLESMQVKDALIAMEG